jgi:cell division transport system permease protein
LSTADLNALLEPWLGAGADRLGLPLPGVIAVRLTESGFPVGPLAERVRQAVPGTQLEDQGIWLTRLAALAQSLQLCAAAALLIVAGVAAAVIAVATRGGLAARREAIEIVHGLGASDSYIAGRFAARATLLAAAGGIAGGLMALPVLLGLAQLVAPFANTSPEAGVVETLPVGLWLLMPGLPLAAAAIGFVTAQSTVRRWLRQLP